MRVLDRTHEGASCQGVRQQVQVGPLAVLLYEASHDVVQNRLHAYALQQVLNAFERVPDLVRVSRELSDLRLVGHVHPAPALLLGVQRLRAIRKPSGKPNPGVCDLYREKCEPIWHELG